MMKQARIVQDSVKYLLMCAKDYHKFIKQIPILETEYFRLPARYLAGRIAFKKVEVFDEKKAIYAMLMLRCDMTCFWLSMRAHVAEFRITYVMVIEALTNLCKQCLMHAKNGYFDYSRYLMRVAHKFLNNSVLEAQQEAAELGAMLCAYNIEHEATNRLFSRLPPAGYAAPPYIAPRVIAAFHSLPHGIIGVAPNMRVENFAADRFMPVQEIVVAYAMRQEDSSMHSTNSTEDEAQESEHSTISNGPQTHYEMELDNLNFE